MKISDAMKAVYAGWAPKRKGYRVRYQRFDGEAWVTDYTPQSDERLLDSEVFARKLARRLSQLTLAEELNQGSQELANLVVVDEENEPIESYVTGAVEIFNPRDL
jgi:hypothetical protein